MNTEYGNRLRTARTHAKLTQVQLSEKTGIPQSTISTAERLGRGSAETTSYALACGVSALWLATGHGGMLDGMASDTQTPLTDGEQHTIQDRAANYKVTTKTGGCLRQINELLIGLHPTLMQPGRDVLERWAKGEIETDSAASTLDALSHVSKSLNHDTRRATDSANPRQSAA